MVMRSSTGKATTLADIAKHLDVSVSTVSRALNDSAEISHTTREKVLKAASELNYSPNEAARNLVTKTNNTVAALVPDILNPFYAEIIRSVENVLSANNFSLLLCITNESDVQVDYYLNEMLKKRVSGILLLSVQVRNAAMLKRIKENSIVIGVSTCHDDIDQVANPEGETTTEIVRHLIELGHRRIAFIGYHLHRNKVLNMRLDGYKKALIDAGLPIDESLIIDGQPIDNPGFEDAKALLRMKNRPTAIHCMNEYLAMGAYVAICEEGMRIPQDISLTGHDGLEITRLIQPALTTVYTPVAAMGEAAAELILQRIAFGKKKVRQLLLFDAHVKLQNSTAKPYTEA